MELEGKEGMLVCLSNEIVSKIRVDSGKGDVSDGIAWIIEHYHTVGGELIKLQDMNAELKNGLRIENDNFNELRCHNKALAEENKELKAYNDAADERNTELNDVNEQNAGVIARQEKLIDELKLKLKTAEKQLTDMSKNYSDACIREHALKEKYGKLSELAKSKVDLKEEYREKWSAMYDENEELKAQIRELLSMDHDEPYEKIDELRGRIVDLENENEELRACKIRQDDETEKAENRALEAKQKLSLINADWASLDRRNNELNGALKQANETIDKLMEGLLR